MITKPVSPKVHGITDYALAGSLLLFPHLFHFPKQIKKIYTAEALLLLGYISFTDHPTAIKPLIPFSVHGKIDPFNVAQFATQTFWKPFRKNKGAQAFNILFTLAAGTIVAFTDWNGPTKKHPAL